MQEDDLYAELGIEPRASFEQVERAYRFSMELWGDGALATYSLLEPGEAEERRARVKRAYGVLSDPVKRREYDERHGHPPPDAAPLPVPVPAAAKMPEQVSGPALRRVREARGLTLPQIASTTKIGTRTLEAIEDDRFDALPPAVYLRGFLHEYARLVGLDPRQVAEAYMRRPRVRK
jgi:flagellar biosynthesis protein FlhG